MSSRSSRRDESGAILVITTITLAMLMGIAALAIDISYGHLQQRRLQNGADASALGAVQDLATTSGTAAATATADAQSIASSNLPKNTLVWASCVDSGKLVHVSAVSQCISFAADGRTVRVRIPRQTFSTLFGGIMGFKNLSASRAAVAKISLVGGGSGVEPFTVLAGFGAGDFCLDSGGGGNSTQPCDGPTTGNFGLLDFASCSGNNYSLNDDIAAGADHSYAPEAVQGVGDVPDNCTQIELPNTVSPKTGNVVGQEGPPMVGNATFADSGPARLRRTPPDPGSFAPNWEITSDGLDNRPLWEFIPNTTLTGIPDSCQRVTFTNLLGATPPGQQQAEMYWAVDRCIFEYTCGKLDTSTGPNDAKFTDPNVRYNCGGARAGTAIGACGGTQCRAPVFTNDTNPALRSGLNVVDLVDSPRFVYLPQMWQSVKINGNSGTYEIKSFRALFIQGVGPNNGTRFEPGPWNNGAAPVGQVANVTGFMFPAPVNQSCTPTATDSCGTMLPGKLGIQPTSLGDNAVIQLTG